MYCNSTVQIWILNKPNTVLAAWIQFPQWFISYPLYISFVSRPVLQTLTIPDYTGFGGRGIHWRGQGLSLISLTFFINSQLFLVTIYFGLFSLLILLRRMWWWLVWVERTSGEWAIRVGALPFNQLIFLVIREDEKFNACEIKNTDLISEKYRFIPEIFTLSDFYRNFSLEIHNFQNSKKNIQNSHHFWLRRPPLFWDTSVLV